jgi:hypothetical protein
MKLAKRETNILISFKCSSINKLDLMKSTKCQKAYGVCTTNEIQKIEKKCIVNSSEGRVYIKLL